MLRLNLPEVHEVIDSDLALTMGPLKPKQTGRMQMSGRFILVVIAGQVITAPIADTHIEQNGAITIPFDA